MEMGYASEKDPRRAATGRSVRETTIPAFESRSAREKAMLAFESRHRSLSFLGFSAAGAV
jgi:hypothetical protein